MQKLVAWAPLLLVSVISCQESPTAKPGPKPDPKAAALESTPKSPAGTPSDGVDAQTFPLLGPVPPQNGQASTKEKITLGHHLFFEKRLSVDGSVSCYSCHQNENGNGGATPLAVGAKAKKLTRHSPTLWNVGYLSALYWDGRAPSLEAQAKGAWSGGNMGVGDQLEQKAKEVLSLPEYRTLFQAAFPGESPKAEHVTASLASFERTLICKETRYDKYAAGDKSLLSPQEKAGLGLFVGKAGCAMCHTPPHFSSAYFSAGTYFNVGIGTQGKPENEVDAGRKAISTQEADHGAFKPPTLRNVNKSAPYFHDGSVATLREAVALMARGGIDNKNKSPLLVDRKLSDEELDQIVAFLSALDCPNQLTPP